MKKMVLGVALLCLLTASTAMSSFPPVPTDAEVYPVEHFYNIALMYSWAEGGELFVHFKLLCDRFYVCNKGFRLIQNGSEFSDLSLITESGTSFCGEMTDSQTFKLQDLSGLFSASDPFIVEFSANDIYQLSITPSASSALLPQSGIWKDTACTVSFYLQKYSTNSAAIVATTNGLNNVIFLDSDYTDGLYISNDLGNQGYSFRLVLKDRTNGTLIADLPGGRVLANVTVVYSVVQ